MRRTGFLLASLLVAGLGCDKRDRDTAADAAERVGDRIEEGAQDLKEGTQAAVDSARLGARRAADYTFEQRTEIRRDLSARLEEMDRAIDRAAAEVRKQTDPPRARAIETYRQVRNEVRAGFDRLEAATAATWEDVRSRFDRSWNELQAAYAEVTHGEGAMGGQGPAGKDTTQPRQ